MVDDFLESTSNELVNILNAKLAARGAYNKVSTYQVCMAASDPDSRLQGWYLYEAAR